MFRISCHGTICMTRPPLFVRGSFLSFILKRYIQLGKRGLQVSKIYSVEYREEKKNGGREQRRYVKIIRNHKQVHFYFNVNTESVRDGRISVILTKTDSKPFESKKHKTRENTGGKDHFQH